MKGSSFSFPLFLFPQDLSSSQIHTAQTLRGDGSKLTIIQDDDHYEHNDDDEIDAKSELQTYLDDIADALKKHSETKVDGIFNEKLSEMVYGSNMVEGVGSSLDITSELCRDIFAGVIDADDVEISDQDPIYKAVQMKLIEKCKPSAHEDVLRTLREVV
ncbi:adenosine monophosphate transferase FICD like [Fusarium mexicanum]|uniref:Adenosine monophosphate transferase FICD like n=1 Tax=Fusarium mexicanum TaxID=751941 RepID=A0A8H5MRT3_9HYPO|nr:adenosine monophosphate transferase FICD like [Fusarium mexicanum]